MVLVRCSVDGRSSGIVGYMSRESNVACPLLLVGGAGGHGEQLLRLRAQLRLGDTRVAVVLERGTKWPYEDRVYYADRIVDYHKRSRWRSIKAFIAAMWMARSVFRQCEPKLVVSTGPGLAVPVCLVAKLFGRAEVVHIESWSRIRSISNTTRLLRHMRLADVVAYQYSNSVLAGKQGCEYWGHL